MRYVLVLLIVLGASAARSFVAGGEVGACCSGANNCSLEKEEACIQYSSTFFGNGTVCNADGSSLFAGACCLGEQCQELLESECALFLGTYFGHQSSCGLQNSCPDV